jgi:hypothetical protein
MAVLFDLARPLAPYDRRFFVDDVAAELNGRAEIDVGLVHRVAVAIQREYLSFARGAGRVRIR